MTKFDMLRKISEINGMLRAFDNDLTCDVPALIFEELMNCIKALEHQIKIECVRGQNHEED